MNNNNKKRLVKILVIIIVGIILFGSIKYLTTYCGEVDKTKIRTDEEIIEFVKDKLHTEVGIDDIENVDIEIVDKEKYFYSFRLVPDGPQLRVRYIKGAYRYNLNCTYEGYKFDLTYIDAHYSRYDGETKYVEEEIRNLQYLKLQILPKIKDKRYEH